MSSKYDNVKFVKYPTGAKNSTPYMLIISKYAKVYSEYERKEDAGLFCNIFCINVKQTQL